MCGPPMMNQAIIKMLEDQGVEPENAVIDNLRELGNELLTDWGAYKENQKFEEVCDLHPEAVAKKSTYCMST